MVNFKSGGRGCFHMLIFKDFASTCRKKNWSIWWHSLLFFDQDDEDGSKMQSNTRNYLKTWVWFYECAEKVLESYYPNFNLINFDHKKVLEYDISGRNCQNIATTQIDDLIYLSSQLFLFWESILAKWR